MKRSAACAPNTLVVERPMVETFRVIVSPRAFDDLDSIFDYIKSNSPQNARKMVDRLWAAMQSLSTLPLRYKVYRRAHGPYRRTVRAMPVRPFIIYYRGKLTKRGNPYGSPGGETKA
jgi:plasmid stabilization system protein ParE